MQRIEKGIIAFKKDGTIVYFPDGNVGKDNEYLRFNKTPESKELVVLFGGPSFLFDHLKENRALEDIKDWLEEMHPDILEDYEVAKRTGG